MHTFFLTAAVAGYHIAAPCKSEDSMSRKRKIEVFSAGCPACQEVVELLNRLACTSCEVSVLDMHEATVADRAKRLDICSVPAVVIDGRLAECCAGRGVDERTLQAAGVGRPLA